MAEEGFCRATRMQGVEVSEVARISERARALRAEGRDIVALSTGEPDFSTPAPVIDAAHKAALAGKTGYPPPPARLSCPQPWPPRPGLRSRMW